MQEIDYKSLPSIYDIVNESLHLRSARIVKRRMEGASLHDVAVEEGLTRTEVRSTEKKGLEKVFTDDLLVKEDEYKYLYETYSIEDEFYQSLINGNQVIYYLKNRYEIGLGSLTPALNDKQITDKIKDELKSFFKLDQEESSQAIASDSLTSEDYTSDNDSYDTICPQETSGSSSSTENVTYVSSDADNTGLVPQYVRDAIYDLWNTFQACGITEPARILEQASIFFFLKYLDDSELKNTAECFANGTPIKSLYFDDEHQSCRWSYFHNLNSNELLHEFSDKIMPFIKKELRVDTNLNYAKQAMNVQLTIADPTLLTKIISTIDAITASSYTNLYSIYEILISMSGNNPKLMDLVCPAIDISLNDKICNVFPDNDFSLSSIAAYLKTEYKDELEMVWHKEHFKNEMFHTYNTNSNVLLISSLRLLLQDIPTPDIQSLDILMADCNQTFTKVIAKIPSKPPINHKYVRSSIKSMITANIPTLMYMYGCHEILESDGICLMSLPHRNLTENSASHRRLREFYLNQNTVLGIISFSLYNRDLLIYKNSFPPSLHQTLFARIDELSADKIKDLCSIMYSSDTNPSEYQNRNQPFFMVPDYEIAEHDFNFGYEEYSTKSDYSDANLKESEKLDIILRRIYSTQFDIDKSINTIKNLLEKL